MGRIAIGTVRVNATYVWSGEVRMIQMDVEYNNEVQAVFLRGATVDMLTVVTDGTDRCIVHVSQPRVAVGQTVRSNPSGMVDLGESRAAAALREVAEEVGADVRWGRAVSMHPTVLGTEAPLHVSPGGTDEEVTFFAVEGRTSTSGLRQLANRIGGLAHENERVRVHLTPLPASGFAGVLRALGAPRLGRPDLKAVTSLMMYQQYLQQNR